MKVFLQGFLLLVGSIIMVGGCGGTGPTSMPAGQAELSGVVKNQGRPLSFRNNVYYKLIFEPIGGPPAAEGSLSTQLSEDGTYSFSLPIGEYNAKIVDSNSKPVGQPVKVSANENKTIDIDVTASKK